MLGYFEILIWHDVGYLFVRHKELNYNEAYLLQRPDLEEFYSPQ